MAAERTSPEALRRLLRPASVAVIGASDVPTSVGGAPFVLLDRFGFSGDVFPVNPSREHVAGRPCLRSIDDLPRGVDAAILAIPRAAVPAAMEALAARGVGGVVVFSSGYAETGPEGAADQRALEAFARAHGIALAGPNCLGLVNFVDGVPLTFGDASPNRVTRPRGVAVIAQSGAMTLGLTYAAMAKDVSVTYAVSTGNEAVLGVEDYLGAIVEDDATAVVALLVEQIRRPQDFLAAARRARERGVLVAVVHLGRGARSRAASATHTGALAGDQAVLRAVLGREGVVFLDSLDELIDFADVAAKCPLPAVAGVGFLTDSGAMKSFALDLSESIGLTMVELTEGAAERLAGELPAFAVAENPVDITASGLNDPSLYARATSVLLEAPEVGGVVLAVMPGSPLQGAEQIGALVPAVEGAPKPVLYTILGGDCPLPEENVARIRDADVPLFRSPERALRAMRNLERAAASRSGPPAGDGAPLGVAPLGVTARVGEYEAKALLRSIGVATPEGRLATSEDEVRAAGLELGYPLVVKIASPDLVHKSRVGGVATVRDAAEVGAAYRGVLERVARAAPEAAIDGVLVEEAVADGVEVIVSARRDPAWGPVILLGAGGTDVESTRDVVVLDARASRGEIREAIGALRIGPDLLGAAGPAARDVDALVDVAYRLARALESSPQVEEIEVNPLLVREVGRGAVALDAVILAP